MEYQHYNPDFNPIILSFFKQNPHKEHDRLSVSTGLKLNLVQAQEHLDNLLLQKKLEKTLSFKYVLKGYKDDVEGNNYEKREIDYEPDKHEEDGDFLSLHIMKELGGDRLTVIELSKRLGMSKFDLELSLMTLVVKGRVCEDRQVGRSYFYLPSLT